MLVVGCIQVRYQLCGGKLLGLKQGVEPVHNADVQLTVHGAQIHLDLGLSGHHAEATFSTLRTEPNEIERKYTAGSPRRLRLIRSPLNPERSLPEDLSAHPACRQGEGTYSVAHRHCLRCETSGAGAKKTKQYQR